jgi:hypothetical protein
VVRCVIDIGSGRRGVGTGIRVVSRGRIIPPLSEIGHGRIDCAPRSITTGSGIDMGQRIGPGIGSIGSGRRGIGTGSGIVGVIRMPRGTSNNYNYEGPSNSKSRFLTELGQTEQRI